MNRTKPVVVFAFVLALSPAAFADGKPVKLIKQWSGSVNDADLAKDAPEVISDAKALAKLWKSWNLAGKSPEVDFDKELVVVTTTAGSKLNLIANLDDKGNLRVIGQATRDFGPGFRYVIATISREGVKTVNGKELKSK